MTLITMLTRITRHAAVNHDDVDDNDDPDHTARRRGEAFAGIAVIIGTGWMQMLRPYSIAANTGDTMPRHGIDIVDDIHAMHVTCV